MFNRRILLIGPTGQIGWELLRCAQPLGQVFAVGRSASEQILIHIDLADPDSICSVVREVKPDIILNAAAYTAVDNAEAEKEAGTVHAVNGIAPGILAEEALRLRASFVHYSTDYVFDGSGSQPYMEQEEINPICLYGESKLAGEQAIQAVGGQYFILRTSWIYGLRGRNFLRTMQRLVKKHGELKIVADQIGSPTWSRLVAEATVQMLSQIYSPMSRTNIDSVAGIYHLTCAGQTNWYEFAKAIIAHKKNPPNIEPITTAEYPTPAKRPAYSVLSNAKFTRTFGITLPNWNETLELCLLSE